LYCYAFDPAMEFAKANTLYQSKSYDSAAIAYKQLIDQKFISAEVYYNLGNCFYKTGNTAKAILNFERALTFKPGDEDVNYNIKVAQLKTVDKIETVPEIFYLRWLHRFSIYISTDQWSYLMLIFAWCICLSLMVYLLSLYSWVKRMAFMFSMIFLFLTLCSWYITQQSYMSRQIEKSAIVMSVSVYVKSSPGESNTDLFLLHEGIKVQLLDTYEDWLKIRIANGNVGWLKRGDVEEI
jgi:tetratricopeptide (TPR) repeat protein